jgi:hypothetical protein
MYLLYKPRALVWLITITGALTATCSGRLEAVIKTVIPDTFHHRYFGW